MTIPTQARGQLVLGTQSILKLGLPSPFSHDILSQVISRVSNTEISESSDVTELMEGLDV